MVAKILGNGHGPHVASVTMGYVHTADLDYIAAELAQLSYVPQASAQVIDLNSKRERRSGP